MWHLYNKGHRCQEVPLLESGNPNGVTNLQAPTTDGLGADRNPPLPPHLLHLTVTPAEAAIQLTKLGNRWR